jgi:hypothetical protein
VVGVRSHIAVEVVRRMVLGHEWAIDWDLMDVGTAKTVVLCVSTQTYVETA